MRYQVFAIFDAAAEAYLPPFMLPTEGMAKRQFEIAINDDKTQFWHSPQDYTLFELGIFDDASGTYELHSPKKSHGNGVEYIRHDSNDSHGDLFNGTEHSKPPQPNGAPVQSGSTSEDSSQ